MRILVLCGNAICSYSGNRGDVERKRKEEHRLNRLGQHQEEFGDINTIKHIIHDSAHYLVKL